MRKYAFVVGAVFFLIFAVSTAHAKDVYTITVNGAITPPVVGFIKESIDKTVEKGGQALVILLDTPGGLATSMHDIVKDIMDSPIPVIVYVAPSGARAASAGCIILLASHVAAMAPGTNVGAAHPVAVGKEQPDKVMEKKIVQDAEASARSIAMKRGRNVEWAAKAVTESSSITAQDALDKRVIDVIAENLDDLLARIDGRSVETKVGKVLLRTKGAPVKSLSMSAKYRFLSYISDPNVAYILMMLGIYGILFELYSPGAIFPGVVGGMAIVLALYAFQTIPISLAGVALIMLGIIFFVLEVKVVSHGLLGIAGVVSIVIGSVMLVDVPSSGLSISWTSIAVVAGISALFVFVVLGYAVKAKLSKVKTGVEGLVGEIGVTKTDVHETGKIAVHGELWSARSDEPIKSGEKVVVVSVEGLEVKIKRNGRAS